MTAPSDVESGLTTSGLGVMVIGASGVVRTSLGLKATTEQSAGAAPHRRTTSGWPAVVDGLDQTSWGT
jgi:hypothetical protein